MRSPAALGPLARGRSRARGDNVIPTGERRPSEISASRQYAPYLEADWGFKNAWYPALFTHELGENTYPALERAGIIFILLGDQDFKPVPSLESTCRFYSTSRSTYGVSIVRAIRTGGWVLSQLIRTLPAAGRQNGFDPGHLLIHWDNQIVAATDRKLALGVQPMGEGAIKIIDEPDGPKGRMNMYNTRAYKFIMDKPEVKMRARGKNEYYARTSVFLPGLLLVGTGRSRGGPSTNGTYRSTTSVTSTGRF
jgi:Homotrimeric ring hydroxylase